MASSKVGQKSTLEVSKVRSKKQAQSKIFADSFEKFR
jgi:hypothetical protein